MTTVDTRDPAFRDNPYPLLRALRERGRVERDVIGIRLVGHHADASAGLRNNKLSREPWRLQAAGDRSAARAHRADHR